MKPEDLQSWQADASLEQLADFIEQNKTLFTLLDEAWAKFMTTQPEKPAPEPVYVSHYGEGIDVENLEHFPVSQEEMIEFLKHFEKERFHNDRPFGNHIHINEQNWEIDGLAQSDTEQAA